VNTTRDSALATFGLYESLSCFNLFVDSVSSGGELSERVGTVPRRATHSRAVCRRYVPCVVSGLLRHCADSTSNPLSYRHRYI